MKIERKKALVTGGGSGLGLSIAKALADKGAEVVICGRTEDQLQKEAGDAMHYEVCDVSDYGQVKDMLEKLGSLDVVVNAAGVWLEGELVDYDQEQIDVNIDVNLKGVIYTSRLVLPQIIQSKGVIVNVVSTTGLKARENQTVYAAAKWGVRGFTESLQLELQAKGVRVIGIYPGGMATEFFEKGGTKVDNSSWMNTDEVAEAVIFTIEHGETLDINELVLNRKKS